MDFRFYTTTLLFAQDLCTIVSTGINTELRPDPEPEVKLDLMDVNITRKNAFTDKRERKRLGKRILKTAQPLLEAALRRECEVTHKSIKPLVVELTAMIDAALEFRDLNPDVRPEEHRAAGEASSSQDVHVPDEPKVGDASADADEPTVEAQIHWEAASGLELAAAGPDTMQIDGRDQDDPDGKPDDTMTVQKSPSECLLNQSVLSNGTSHKGEIDSTSASGANDSTITPSMPPFMNGHVPTVAVQPPSNNTIPPTPPQSNGSLGKEPADPLTEGGVPWYFKDRFKLSGTEASEELWAGRDAVRSLSEELTDIDDEEFRGLEETVLESVNAARPLTMYDNLVSARVTRVQAQSSTDIGERSWDAIDAAPDAVVGTFGNGDDAARLQCKEQIAIGTEAPVCQQPAAGSAPVGRREIQEKGAISIPSPPAPPRSSLLPAPAAATRADVQGSAGPPPPPFPLTLLPPSTRPSTRNQQKRGEKERENKKESPHPMVTPTPTPTIAITKKTTRSASAAAAAAALTAHQQQHQQKKGTRSSTRTRRL